MRLSLCCGREIFLALFDYAVHTPSRDAHVAGNRAMTDCHKKLRFACQKERSSVLSHIPATKRMDENRGRTVKKRSGKLSVWSISPPPRAFLCGKNGISLLKEIFFLPQRRKFLAAKTFQRVWKKGKTRASDGFSFLIGPRPRAKIDCPFASLGLRRADPWTEHGRTTFRLRRQNVAEAGLPSPFCISASPRGLRVFVRFRPCVRPRDSRGVGFDVLTMTFLFRGGCAFRPWGNISVGRSGFGAKVAFFGAKVRREAAPAGYLCERLQL